MYFVYMIKNDFGKLYIGITGDPRVRAKDHNTGRGARSTKSKAKFNVVFLEEYSTLSEARRREIQIKKWQRGGKRIFQFFFAERTDAADHASRMGMRRADPDIGPFSFLPPERCSAMIPYCRPCVRKKRAKKYCISWTPGKRAASAFSSASVWLRLVEISSGSTNGST